MKHYGYTDASLYPEEDYFYYAGYLTDEHSKIIFCFFEMEKKNSKNFLNIDCAEALAIKKIIEYATELDIKNLELRTDSHNTVTGIQKYYGVNEKCTSTEHSLICEDIYSDLTEFFDTFSISHIYRERNYLADRLAHYAKSWHTSNKQEHKNFTKHMERDCKNTMAIGVTTIKTPNSVNPKRIKLSNG